MSPYKVLNAEHAHEIFKTGGNKSIEYSDFKIHVGWDAFRGNL